MANSDYDRFVPATPAGKVLPLVVDTLRTDIAADTGWTTSGWSYTSDWARGPAHTMWQPFAIRVRNGEVFLNGVVRRTGAAVPAGTIFGRLIPELRPSRTEISPGMVRFDVDGYVSSEVAVGAGELMIIRNAHNLIG